MFVEKEDSGSATMALMRSADNPDLVSNEALYYFLLVNLWGPGLAVCVFGILTNILNIITFIKQGVGDTVNISLLGLATSDLGSQIALFFTNICLHPGAASLDLPFVVIDVIYVTGLIRILFTRVTTLITSYITLERCLCVTTPLKVKNIFTPQRTVLYLVGVYVIMLASVSPCFYICRSALIFDPVKNKSLLGFTFTEDRPQIDQIAYMLYNVVPTVAFLMVIFCTAVLVYSLHQKSRWRKQAATSSCSKTLSNRDSKVGKMVVLISATFITCYFPGTAVFIWLILDPEMRFDGLHSNQLLAAFSIIFNLESINAGVNIFIYFTMSSKFRATFLTLISFKSTQQSFKQAAMYESTQMTYY